MDEATTQDGQVLAEVYRRGARGGEPLATVAGTRERVLAKAGRVAREHGCAVEVWVSGTELVWRVAPAAE